MFIMLIIGSHMSISSGFLNAVKKTVENYNSNALQIFLKSPQSLSFCSIKDEEANETKKYIKKSNVFLVGHCSYLLNFAKIQEYKTEDIYEQNFYSNTQENIKKELENRTKKIGNWAVNSLVDDLYSIYKMGGYGVVLHIGKYVDLDKKIAINNVVKNIKQTIEDISYKTKNVNTPYIILENTAGQGTEIGSNFEELLEIYNLLNRDKRIKFCIDTAHAFSSGYDLKDHEKFNEFIGKFDKNIGIKNIGLFHFNDSKKDLNSRVDRHESIGHGLIGENSLKYIADFAIKNTIPLIIETPDKEVSHLEDINRIKNWYKS